jgi:imidazolonepropionase-like amidohydrolase
LYPDWYQRPEITDIYDTLQFQNLQNPEVLQTSRAFISSIYGVDNPSIENIINPQTDDIKVLYERGINIVLGTDTGNDFIFPGYSMHEEMQLMEMGGFKPMDIIKMATHNAAKMLKASDWLGSIAEGKIADMILLDKNPLESIENTLSISKVIKNGKIQKRI